MKLCESGCALILTFLVIATRRNPHFCGLPSRPGLLPNPQTQGVDYLLEKWSFRKTTPLTCLDRFERAPAVKARELAAARSSSASDRPRGGALPASPVGGAVQSGEGVSIERPIQ